MKTWKRNLASCVLSAGLLIGSSGCENNAQTNAGLGGLIGAGVGQLAGRDSESTLLGAGIGAGVGYIIGNEQDKKEEKARTQAQIRNQLNTEIIWIKNTNNSKTPVKLRKEGPGYLGPRGEYYESMPTEAQLQDVYGF